MDIQNNLYLYNISLSQKKYPTQAQVLRIQPTHMSHPSNRKSESELRVRRRRQQQLQLSFKIQFSRAFGIMHNSRISLYD
jgi:hypothetical protein